MNLVRSQSGQRLSILAALGGTLVAGCANLGVPSGPYADAPIGQQLERPDVINRCGRVLWEADARVDAAGVRDGQAPRVAGYPYLRVDRFAVALARTSPAVNREAWIDYASALDTEARRAEWANLGDRLDAAALEQCRRILLADTRANPVPGAVDPLVAAQVPDDYSTTLRVLGLYPLTSLAFAAGISSWHRDVREVFAVPIEKLPVRGPRTRYVPAAPDAMAEPAGWMAPGIARALGVPPLAVDEAWRLLHENAPVLAVETASADDRVGALVWREGGGGLRVGVDVQAPVAYARLAYALISGRVHLQLVYSFWFPARPPTSPFDLLAGPLDGLIWRVTLDGDFRPLVYDTIHPCGCYHLFFPTDRARARAQPPPEQGRFDEGLFAPQSAPVPGAGERMQLFIEARTHYVQRLVATADTSPISGETRRFGLVSEDGLRALPLPAGGTRSVYGENGLIAVSERGERFYFWPMGIESAGQMRQWGRHATAFVGRRHFDGPLLLDRYFEFPP